MSWIPTPLLVGSAAVSLTTMGFLLRDIITGGLYEGKEKLNDKVVIITGANTGIGKEIAKEMARREAKVVMACRDMDKCEKTRREIVLATKHRFVYCRECDLASQSSIRQFVDVFKKEHQKLHILVNNAGVMRCPQSFTKDGIETQLGVNHMGHFLLTNLLLDVLKASAPSKIINVSSVAHLKGEINVKDLNSIEKYDPADAYAQSKLANVLFTRELSKRLAGTGVTVNAVHPGIVDTEITRHMAFTKSSISNILMTPLFWLFIKSPRYGAQPIIRLAIDPDFKDENGAYFNQLKKAEPSDEAKNDELAKWLWLTSEKWTKLTAS